MTSTANERKQAELLSLMETQQTPLSVSSMNGTLKGLESRVETIRKQVQPLEMGCALDGSNWGDSGGYCSSIAWGD